MIRSFFTRLLDFAESKFAECEGRDRETVEAIALGGGDITLPQQLRGHGAGIGPANFESFQHGQEFYQ